MKSSWRWGLPLGGCKWFCICKVLRTVMANWADFLPLKTFQHIYLFHNNYFGQFFSRLGCKNYHFLKAFFICSFRGAVTALLLAAPLNPWRSPISAIAFTAILLAAPLNPWRSSKSAIAVPLLLLGRDDFKETFPDAQTCWLVTKTTLGSICETLRWPPIPGRNITSMTEFFQQGKKVIFSCFLLFPCNWRLDIWSNLYQLPRKTSWMGWTKPLVL